MKLRTQAILALLLFFLSSTPLLHASHSMGADLTYSQIGPNQYRIRLQFYRDCAGILPAGSYTINANSITCSQSTSVTVSQISFTEVSPLCTAQISNSTCNGGALPGVQQYIYEGVITLPMACSDWRFSFTECCRNSGITTLSSPGSENLFVDATLNNIIATTNSSPQFTSLPVPYICAGQSYVYNHGAVDVDGDSLVFSLLNAQNGAGTSVAYAGGFSGLNPMTSVPAVTINSVNGDVTMNPTVPQSCVIAVRVLEYRNGVVIGSTTRDIQVVVLNCTNNVPTVGASVTGVVNGIQTGPYSISVCPGQTLSFNISGSDIDPGQILTWTSNNGIPGGTFVGGTGLSPQSASFSWTPTQGDVGLNTLLVTLRDNGCAVLGQQTRSINITVLQGTSAGPDLVYCTGGGPTQLGVVGGTSFTWNVLSGTPGSLSCTNCANPTATPLVPTTYQVVSNLPGTCKNRDTVVVTPVPTFSLTMGGPQTICTGSSTTLSAVPSPAGAYTYLWSPTTGLSSSTIGNPTCTPTSTTTYNVSVTSTAGCRITGSQAITVSTAVLNAAPTASPLQSCAGSPVTLNANVTGGNCTNYQVTSIPFSPIMTAGTPVTLSDDQMSAAIPIGFNFTFYCNSYSNVYISSNGFITFSSNIATGPTSQLIPNAAFPNDVIAAGWHDLYPPGAGSITYQTTGVMPNRKFIVTYNGVPYCCGTTPAVTSQIILSETVNEIEIHNTAINAITPGTQGIENSTGTLALTVTGRNNSNWTATNDAYKFSLVPPPPFTVNWQAPLGNTVATGTSTVVTPAVSTTYFAVASNGACSATASVAVGVTSIDAGPDQTVCPAGSSTSLNAIYTGPPALNNCSTYVVTNIPYAPIAPGGTTLLLGDDQLTGLLPIGFTFTYFCNNYTDMKISSNGFISPTAAGAFPGQHTIPNVLNPNNVIAVGWRDLYPPGAQPGAGLITYQTLGTAPNRTFVVSYVGIPQCCDAVQRLTSQVILYETTNVIEFHNASVSFTFASVQGIENATGTIAFAVPGRNNAIWTATNDAYRFTPQAFPITYSWSPSTFLSATNVSNPNVNAITTTTTYTVNLTNGVCNISDQVTVNVCILGVDAVELTGRAAEDRVKLHWDAINEHDLSHYVIERSQDGVQWTAIGNVRAQGLEGATQSYDHDDLSPLGGTSQYRLRLVDLNGAESHSNTVEVRFEGSGWVNVAPNPSHNRFNFELGNLGAGDITIDIFNAEGRIVSQLKDESGAQGVRRVTADLSEMPAGIYLYRVKAEQQELKGRLLKVE